MPKVTYNSTNPYDDGHCQLGGYVKQLRKNRQKRHAQDKGEEIGHRKTEILVNAADSTHI